VSGVAAARGVAAASGARRVGAGLGSRLAVTVGSRLAVTVGGAARLRVITLLACVLALESADSATIGAIAAPLEAALHIGNTQLGLLVTVSTAVGALAAIPAGALVDRVNRVRLLTVAVVLWSLAMLISGFASSFLMLLVTRLALGAVIAAAGPAIASLTGDFFPAADRGRIFGFVLTGELVGAGVGYLIAGSLAGLLSWRASFLVLAIPGALLALSLRRLLPEPARGGQSQIGIGDTEILVPRSAGAPAPDQGSGGPAGHPPPPPAEGDAERAVRRAAILPHRDRVLDRDPVTMGLGGAIRYVLTVRTNVLLILASALGYFFYAGLRIFAVEFLRGRFSLSQSTGSALLVLIGAGSVLGVLTGGRIADRLIARGHIAGRPLVAGLAFLLAAGLLLPGLLIMTTLVAVPLMFCAAAAYSATNPPLDAARLDVMQHHLWGRAEAVRTTIRSLFVAAAPLVFGYVSTQFGGQVVGLAGSTGSTKAPGAAAILATNARGLDLTFLIMLTPLVAAGALLIVVGRRTYPRDVATAVASEQQREWGRGG
jgi:predicted MFS family arabinose efflux permease